MSGKLSCFVNSKVLLITYKLLQLYKLNRGKICVANFKAPCQWCKFGQVFNGQLGRLYKLGDWKTAENGEC